MSGEAVGWVFRHSPYTGATMLVHLAVADIANDVHDNELWAGVSALAAKARCNPGTLRRALLRMVADGLLEVVEDHAAQHRASRYRLLMPDEIGRVTHATDDDAGRVTHATGRASHATGRVTHATAVAQDTRPIRNASGELEVNASTATDRHERAWLAFWRIYPRKAGKRQARAAFDRACRRADEAVIVRGAQDYADDPNREAPYTAHPTTWLNRDGWADDPLPRRSRNRIDDNLAAIGQSIAGGSRSVLDVLHDRSTAIDATGTEQA